MPEVHQVLLERAVAGEIQPLSELLALCAPEIRRRFNGRISAKYQAAIDVDDILQVTFLEAFLRIRSLKPKGIRSFNAWLLTIAQNNLRDAIRQLERLKNPPPDQQIQSNELTDTQTVLLNTFPSSGTSPSGHAIRGENMVLLEQAIDRLPPDYAKVVRLYDLEHGDVRAVAHAMNRSIGAVYMLRSRAHQCLQEILGSKSDFLTRGA